MSMWCGPHDDVMAEPEDRSAQRARRGSTKRCGWTGAWSPAASPTTSPRAAGRRSAPSLPHPLAPDRRVASASLIACQVARHQHVAIRRRLSRHEPRAVPLRPSAGSPPEDDRARSSRSPACAVRGFVRCNGAAGNPADGERIDEIIGELVDLIAGAPVMVHVVGAPYGFEHGALGRVRRPDHGSAHDCESCVRRHSVGDRPPSQVHHRQTPRPTSARQWRGWPGRGRHRIWRFLPSRLPRQCDRSLHRRQS